MEQVACGNLVGLSGHYMMTSFVNVMTSHVVRDVEETVRVAGREQNTPKLDNPWSDFRIPASVLREIETDS